MWSEGIKQMDFVLKDGNNLHAHKRTDPEKFFPTMVCSESQSQRVVILRTFPLKCRMIARR